MTPRHVDGDVAAEQTDTTPPDGGRPPATSDDSSASHKGPPAARRSRPATLRLLAVAILSLALGVGLTAGLAALRDGSPPPTGASPETTQLPIGEPANVPEITGDVAPGLPADSPEGAVTAFLDAERAGDLAASYLLLSLADRAEYRTPAGWVATHADVLPPVTGYDVEEVTADAGRAAVVTLVGFEPSLDQSVGLVPARARATWTVVTEGDGWAVALQESSFEPLHPPEGDAADAVSTWAASQQRCEPEGEHSVVLGLPALARALCDTTGAVQVGEVSRFSEGFDTNTFLASYGEPVLEWARVVPVTAPVELRAVVAPIGQDWTVIGVLDSRTPR